MLTANKKAYIDYLRDNPKNRTQGVMYFWAGGDCFCALGMAADLFGIPMYVKGGSEEEDRHLFSPQDDYQAVYDALEISDEDGTLIFRLNDTYNKTFAEIADILERYWENPEDRSILSEYE